jgi:hypothetical protein
MDTEQRPPRPITTPAEYRQGVVFAALLEYYQQLFSSPSRPGYGQTLGELGLEPNAVLPAGVKPLPNPARVREYWADVLPPETPLRDYPAEWCGALCLFAIHRAELGHDVYWKGGFAARVLRQRPIGELPEPGDVAYFKRYQHHAIVERVDAEAATFDSIDGNQAPGIRRVAGRKLSAAAAFYSLGPLLEEVRHGT